MSKPNVTPWYPANIKPVREGVYELCWKDFVSGEPSPETTGNNMPYPFHYFDGRKWSPQDCGATPDECLPLLHGAEHTDAMPWYAGFWRGVTEESATMPHG